MASVFHNIRTVNNIAIGADLAVSGDVVITGDLTVSGTETITNIESVNLNVVDNNIYVNNGYTSTTGASGGITVNTSAVNDMVHTVDTGGFTAGVVGVSNPTVVVDTGENLQLGQLIQIKDAANPSNNGLFEVFEHQSSIVTIRGVGINGAVEAFTQSQFTTDTTVAGTIVRVNVSVMRSGADGLWEVGVGNTTPLVFSDVLLNNASIDHGALTGLVDDDHTQYTLLAGRTGGQSLIGGIDASDSLTLESTSNATKGTIDLKDPTRVNDVDTITATTLFLGKATADKVEIGKAGDITEVKGSLTVDDDATFSGRVVEGVRAYTGTGATHILATDGKRVNTVTDTTGGTVTLPTAPTNGAVYTIINIGTTTVTINRGGTDTIDGPSVTSLSLTDQYDRTTLQYDVGIWYTV